MRVFLVATLLLSLAVSVHGGSAEAQRALERGLALEAQGRLAQARDAYSEAIRLDPNFFEAWRKRGWMWNRLGDQKGAIADFDHAIALEPRNATGWNGRGAARHKAGDIEGALQDFQKAIDLDPKYASPWLNRAMLKNDRNDFKGALDDASRAVALSPSDSAAIYSCGQARYLLKDYAGAIEDFSKALALNDKKSIFWDARGQAKRQVGDYRGALVDIERAIALDPKDARFLADRGTVRSKLNDVAGARADFTGALQLDASNSIAKKGLSALDAASAVPGRGTVLEEGVGLQKAMEAEKKAAQTGLAAKGSQQAVLPLPKKPASQPNLPSVQFKADDPCSPQNPTAGTPWQKASTTPAAASLVEGVTLPAPLDAGALSRVQYAGAVSAAHEAMRLLYGPMSEENTRRFESLWAPLFDSPSHEIVDYLNRLNPLLAQFLAGREAMMRAAAGYEAAVLDVSLAVAAKTRTGWDDAMANASRQAKVMQSLEAGMRDLAHRIEALGNPPNPLEAKCNARRRHQAALAATGEASPVGDVFASNVVELSLSGVQGWSSGPGPNPQGTYWLTWDGRSFYWELRGLVDKAQCDYTEDDKRKYVGKYSPEGRALSPPPELKVLHWLRGTLSNDGMRVERLEGGTIGVDMLHQTQFQVGIRDVPFDREHSGDDPNRDHLVQFERQFPNGLAPSDVTLTCLNEKACLGDKCAWQDRLTRGNQFVRVGFWRSKQYPPARYGPLPSPDSTSPGTALADAGKADTAAKAAAEQAVRETIEMHQANITFLDRMLQREQEDLAKETNLDRRGQLSLRVIQLQSDMQAEQDLIASYQTGQIVHTRSAFDEFAQQQFIAGIHEEVARADATLRIARGIEREINLLPEDQRAAMREKAASILDAKAMATGDVEKAKRLAAAIDNQVQGYWKGQAAKEEEKAIAAEEHEFLTQSVVMAAGGVVMGLGAASLAQTFGETAALTIYGPNLIGGIYGGVTGAIAGGPAEGVKQTLAWSSTFGYMATEFMGGYWSAGSDPKASTMDKLWNGAQQAGTAFVLGKAFEFGTGMVHEGAIAFFDKDNRLFKPVVGWKPTASQQFDAARTNQAVQDAKTLVSSFQEKEFELAKLRSSAPPTAPEVQKLEGELQSMAASINSSYHCKWEMKYEAHPLVRSKFNARAEQSYQEMMPEMLENLKALKYDMRGMEFKPVRNPSSAGSSSMDLDLALKERPGMVFSKDGKQVSLQEFMTDAQGAMNRAYHKVTGFSATRSEINLTTSLHSESFTDLRLLKKNVDFSTIGSQDIANIGKVVQVKATKIAGDPILSTISKAQASCRESAKEVENMLLPALRQRLQKTKNATEAAELKAAIKHWEGVQKTFKQIGTKETDPYEIMNQERALRELTGGLGIHETVNDLNRAFKRLGATNAR